MNKMTQTLNKRINKPLKTTMKGTNKQQTNKQLTNNEWYREMNNHKQTSKRWVIKQQPTKKTKRCRHT